MSGFSSIFKKWSLEDKQKESSFSALFQAMNDQYFSSSVKTSSASNSNFTKSSVSSSSFEVSVPLAEKKPLSSKKSKKLKLKKVKATSSVDLQEADKLKLSEYLENCIRDSSRRSYLPFWKKYQEFCACRKFNLNSSEAVSLFLISLAESAESKSGAVMARSAIKYFLKIENPAKKSLTDSYLVQKVVKSIVKKYSRQVKKAKTLCSNDIKKLVLSLLDSGSFLDERSANFFLIQYTLYGRFEEVASLKRENFNFLDSGHLEVTIPKAKNFEVFDSKTSLIAKGDDFNPVGIVKAYLSKFDSEFVFPNFRNGKKGKIEFKPSSVSYSNMLKLLRSSLDKIGLIGQDYSLHSLRTGALSEAANSNIDRSLLQRHGRWKSSQMVNHYHKLSLGNRLAPTLALAIYDN